MSNLPDCTGCTDPDPFDRNSDGVTHQTGTKQHPMTTPERQVATAVIWPLSELTEVCRGIVGYRVGSENEPGAELRAIAMQCLHTINRLSAAQSDWECVAQLCRNYENRRGHSIADDIMASRIIAAHVAPLRKRLDEAVALLKRLANPACAIDGVIDRASWFGDREDANTFLARHQRDNAQGEG